MNGEFSLVTTIRVRYSETDQMKIVYNANYLDWFEIARTELCRRWGRPYTEWEAEGADAAGGRSLLPLTRAPRATTTR